MIPIRPRLTPELHPTLTDLAPLRLGAPDAASDLPGHVRAGSALRRWGGALAVIQDDVHAVAVLEAGGAGAGAIRSLLLPPGADGRRSFGEATGNKALKLDLEALVVLPDGALLAFGSGSLAARERLVRLTPDGRAQLVYASELYAVLRARVDFAGSELNIEGAVVVGGVLRLFQRGNGAVGSGLAPADATLDLPLGEVLAYLAGGPPPTLGLARRYDLGRAPGGARYTFTDAAALPDGRVAFLAAAEASPDTYRDGAVAGCRLGILGDGSGADGEGALMADVLGEDGAPVTLKLEGLELEAEEGDLLRFHVVVDADDPHAPALLGTLTARARAR